jgi:hypothetical protein
MPWPSPREAPVTIATLPFNLNFSKIELIGDGCWLAGIKIQQLVSCLLQISGGLAFFPPL